MLGSKGTGADIGGVEGGRPNVRRLFVTEDEVVAARRLLSVLASGDGSPHPGDMNAVAQQVREQLGLRQRRMKVLGKTFAAEAPFLLLIALYAIGGHDVGTSKTQLQKLSGLTWTTAERWLDVLKSEDWIQYHQLADDRKRVFVRLTASARAKIEALFS